MRSLPTKSLHTRSLVSDQGICLTARTWACCIFMWRLLLYLNHAGWRLLWLVLEMNHTIYYSYMYRIHNGYYT